MEDSRSRGEGIELEREGMGRGYGRGGEGMSDARSWVGFWAVDWIVDYG